MISGAISPGVPHRLNNFFTSSFFVERPKSAMTISEKES